MSSSGHHRDSSESIQSMKLRCAGFLITLSVASLVHAGELGIEFAGVMTAGGKTRIALTDTATKTTTWVEPGGEFKGFTIARYDAKEEAVFLKKGGQETRLGIVAAKTPDAPAAKDSNPSTQAATVAIRANLRQLASAARQYQLEHGATTVNYGDIVGPEKLIKEMKPVAGENYSTLSFGPNVKAVSVTTANGSVVSYDVSAPTAVAGSIGAVAAGSGLGSAGSSATPAPAAPASVAITREQGKPPATTPADSAVSDAEALQPTGRQAVSPSYMIQGGDTWEKISTATGVPVQQLKQLNPSILEGGALPAGQTIRVR